jgi:hypothetical protein
MDYSIIMQSYWYYNKCISIIPLVLSVIQMYININIILVLVIVIQMYINIILLVIACSSNVYKYYIISNCNSNVYKCYIISNCNANVYKYYSVGIVSISSNLYWQTYMHMLLFDINKHSSINIDIYI